jgi:hypothetical protein
MSFIRFSFSVLPESPSVAHFSVQDWAAENPDFDDPLFGSRKFSSHPENKSLKSEEFLQPLTSAKDLHRCLVMKMQLFAPDLR